MNDTKTVNSGENRVLLRSRIAFADYNPRRISDEARKTLRKGLKTFGLVGGVVVNERPDGSLVLVSGHQRLTELDRIRGYPGNDYSVRADVVHLSDSREKELNVLLNNPNAQGEWDYFRLSMLLPEIDAGVAGLTDADLAFLVPPAADVTAEDVTRLADTQQGGTGLIDPTREAERYENEKNRLSGEKRRTLEKAEGMAKDSTAYLCLSFSEVARKAEFCARFGIPAGETIISGEDFGEIVERID